MSLFNTFDISGSALSAQSVRMNITASNMANADSISSSVNEVYSARHPVFRAMLDEQRFDGDVIRGGVMVDDVIESKVPPQVRYEPEHPLADEEGYIYMPNVNVIEEMANMIAASRSYQNNIEVMNASKQMMQRTLSIGQ